VVLTDGAEKLEHCRNQAIRSLLLSVQSLLEDLEEPYVPCSEACSARLLGALRRELRKAGLLQNITGTDPSVQMSYEQLCNVLSSLPTPTWYGSECSGACFVHMNGMGGGPGQGFNNQCGCTLAGFLQPTLGRSRATVRYEPSAISTKDTSRGYLPRPSEGDSS
jgi:hypothetical protein